MLQFVKNGPDILPKLFSIAMALLAYLLIGLSFIKPWSALPHYRPPSGTIGVTQINDWLWWFDYGPSFTQFVTSAWFCAATGYLLAGLCVCGLYWRRCVTQAREISKQSILFIIRVSSNWMLAKGELRMGNVNEAWEARKRSMGK